LAQGALLAVKSAKLPYSLGMVNLFAGLAVALDGMEDKQAAEFRRLLLTNLLGNLDPNTPEVRELAIATIQVLVK
jgi:hypothetical protein